MTVSESLTRVSRAGTVERRGDSLIIRVSRERQPGLEDAMAMLRDHKAEVMALLPEPVPANVAAGEQAMDLLNRRGVRIVSLGNGTRVPAVWSDLDGPDIRSALHVVWPDHPPVRYLDGRGVPMRYKLRKVEGEPVPLSVLEAMEHSAEPWLVRDAMFKAEQQQ